MVTGINASTGGRLIPVLCINSKFETINPKQTQMLKPKIQCGIKEI